MPSSNRLSRLVGLSLLAGISAPCFATDPLRDLQADYVMRRAEKMNRAYHFGSQGPAATFSNHTSHSNRLIPVYTFGSKADLSEVTGAQSRYRDPERIKQLYGVLPPHTVNPAADYCDQSDLYHVQQQAVKKGAKYLFTVWFDGMDWETTRAAAIVKSGRVYTEGKGAGLVFQDYTANGTAQYGFCVTSPTHDKNKADVDTQTVSIPETSLVGGYDWEIAGSTPWAVGPLYVPGYFKGQAVNEADKQAMEGTGRTLHACTDSSQSAGEYATGVKSYNNGVNVTDTGRFVPTLFNQLQAQGWKVGTATSVPFDHVSPAAMYAHNVHRDDYQDLARDMLGLEGIGQQLGREAQHPGLDVVLGAGHGLIHSAEKLEGQGKNSALGQNRYITDADLAAIQVENGGKYVVAQRAKGVNGADSLAKAAERAASEGRRLFGFFGTKSAHLPFRTADGGYDPVNGIHDSAESYSPADRQENPTLADMTRAALRVLTAEKGHPFALFVEAGDVDSGLHDNNLDNAVGAVYSGEEAVQAIIDWVEQNSNWDESILIVTADHGHFLVLDQPEALCKGLIPPPQEESR